MNEFTHGFDGLLANQRDSRSSGINQNAMNDRTEKTSDCSTIPMTTAHDASVTRTRVPSVGLLAEMITFSTC
jgi:hypothetical protein